MRCHFYNIGLPGIRSAPDNILRRRSRIQIPPSQPRMRPSILTTVPPSRLRPHHRSQSYFSAFPPRLCNPAASHREGAPDCMRPRWIFHRTSADWHPDSITAFSASCPSCPGSAPSVPGSVPSTWSLPWSLWSDTSSHPPSQGSLQRTQDFLLSPLAHRALYLPRGSRLPPDRALSA